MQNTCKVPLIGRKVEEKKTIKQHKAVIVALIVICITTVVAVLVTRKDLCGARIRTDQTEVVVFTVYESE